MSVFQADCPYCGTKSVAFTVHNERECNTADLWDIFASCGLCDRSVVASFKPPYGVRTTECLYNPGQDRLETLTIAPSPPDTGAPPHTPENIALFFEQGMDNLVCQNWDASGGMFRKVLETSLKRKFPDIEGSLKERIDKASKKHELTPDMAEWAHQIRLDGNDAVHEEDPFSGKDAQALAAFTDLLLRYLFTLPGMLKKNYNEEDIPF